MFIPSSPKERAGRAMMVAAALLAIAGSAAAQAPHDHVVTMTNMSYGKIPADLKVGDTITWVNRDTVPHTITARDKSFDIRVNPGQTVHQALQKDGSIAIYCLLHPMMRGTLKISAQ